MKIIISESQYKLLLEDIQPFYWQGKDYMGRLNVNGDYQYYGGGLLYGFTSKPQGAIDASFLFPNNQGKYPSKVSKKEVQDIISKQNVSPFGRIKPNVLSREGEIPFPPLDWQSKQEKYKTFNEPLGVPQKYNIGKYKSLLPPQTNAYYFNGRNWIEKGLQNVDEWRDVPSGYHPSEYEAALEWDRENKRGNKPYDIRSIGGIGYNAAESTKSVIQNVNPSKLLVNPYYNPNFPLGHTRKEMEYYNQQKGIIAQKRKQDKFDRDIKLSQQMRIDNTANRQLSDIISRIPDPIQVELDNLNSMFGYYKQVQPKESEGFDWTGFLLTLAGFVPLIGPVAIYANIGINLSKAVKALSENKPLEAGLNVLFAALPGFTSQLRGLNPLNIIRFGTEAEKHTIEMALKVQADKWFSQANQTIVQTIETNLPEISQHISPEAFSEIAKKGISKFGEQFSVKETLKQSAQSYDKDYNKRKA